MSTEIKSPHHELEVGKFYSFCYLYNGKPCESEGVFKKLEGGKAYFQNNSDWTIITPNSISQLSKGV